MKVALCFFGLTRSLRKYTYNSIVKNIFTPLKQQKHSYDVFVHTYNLPKITNPRSHEFNVQLDTGEYKLLNPVRSLVEDQSVIDKTIDLKFFAKNGDPWNDKCISLMNLLRQFNSLAKVWSLVETYTNETKTKYDVVVFLRPDLEYLTPLDLQNKEYTDNKIYIPNFAWYYGYNDRFAFGNPRVMKHYANRLVSAIHYIKLGKPLHSESFLKHHLNVAGVTAAISSIKFHRVRANGVKAKD